MKIGVLFFNTWCLEWLLCELETFWRCSYLTASIWCNHCRHRSASKYRCETKPNCGPSYREPKFFAIKELIPKWSVELFYFTCKIVSKLNVNPFHRVNSPLEAPVINRRPSGVHVRQNTGQRILFVIALQHNTKTKWRRFEMNIPCEVNYFGKSCRYGIAGRVQVARGWDHFWVVTYVGLKASSVSGVSLPDSRLKSNWR